MILVGVLGLLVSAFVVDAGVSMHNPFYCYLTDPIRPHITMHSDHTSYEAVRRTSVNPTVSTCTPSRFWMLARHGGMLPEADLMREIIAFIESPIRDDIARNYDAGRTTLCRQDFESLRDWTSGGLIIENAGLSTRGNPIAMQNIARRYQQFFPTLLTEDYSPDRFHFRHCSMPGSNTSIRAFASGLFGENANIIFENVPERDWFMMPISFCPTFIDLSEPENQPEIMAFQQGPEFEEMVEQVNRKLGFHGSNQLSVENVLTIHGLCRRQSGDRFEAEHFENTGWCAAFSAAHHRLLEYYGDMIYFYLSGYGVRNQRLVENLPCGLLQDLLTHMQSNNNTDQIVRVFVTSPHLLTSVLVTFGAFRDTWPLHQHNFAQQTTRNWITSLMIPLAGNLAVVRYDCADGDHDLVFLLNERPILIPGCNTENGICKLSFILDRFQRYINANCEEIFCSSD